MKKKTYSQAEIKRMTEFMHNIIGHGSTAGMAPVSIPPPLSRVRKRKKGKRAARSKGR